MYGDTWNELVLSENIFHSPNCNKRGDESRYIITHIVIHVTGDGTTFGGTFTSILGTFLNSDK